jgi:predicted DsbA family dithiol-disulfide isomerase
MTTADRQPTVTQFTDPMCTWCWGSEPIVRHLRVAYGDRIGIEYVMGGLIEDFDDFSDPENGISEPGDVAPHWLDASDRHGMPVETGVFETDPARSTYPASVAFVAARRTHPDLAGRYLRRLRAAYATRARNVNRREEQIALARSVGLDVDAFVDTLENGTARAGFEADLARTRDAGVRAFPTYRIEGHDGERHATGFQSFEDLAGALSDVAPGLEQSAPPSVEQFVADYGPVATQEVAEVCGFDRPEARQRLASLAEDDRLSRESRGNGLFWRAPADSDPAQGGGD